MYQGTYLASFLQVALISLQLAGFRTSRVEQ